MNGNQTSMIMIRRGLTALLVLLLSAAGCADCMADPDQAAVPGDATRVAPVAALDAVREFAGADSELVELQALGVRADGTLDLSTDVDARVTYELQGRVAPEDPGAPERYQSILVVLQHAETDSEGMRRTIGMEETEPTGEVVPAPTCALSELWQKAIEDGAPEDATARILYRMQRPPGMGRDKSPSYSFRIPDADVRMFFDASCERIERDERQPEQPEPEQPEPEQPEAEQPEPDQPE